MIKGELLTNSYLGNKTLESLGLITTEGNLGFLFIKEDVTDIGYAIRELDGQLSVLEIPHDSLDYFLRNMTAGEYYTSYSCQSDTVNPFCISRELDKSCISDMDSSVETSNDSRGESRNSVGKTEFSNCTDLKLLQRASEIIVENYLKDMEKEELSQSVEGNNSRNYLLIYLLGVLSGVFGLKIFSIVYINKMSIKRWVRKILEKK